MLLGPQGCFINLVCIKYPCTHIHTHTHTHTHSVVFPWNALETVWDVSCPPLCTAILCASYSSVSSLWNFTYNEAKQGWGQTTSRSVMRTKDDFVSEQNDSIFNAGGRGRINRVTQLCLIRAANKQRAADGVGGRRKPELSTERPGLASGCSARGNWLW